MRTYKVTVLEPHGKGDAYVLHICAASEADAREQLASKGHVVLSVEPLNDQLQTHRFDSKRVARAGISFGILFSLIGGLVSVTCMKDMQIFWGVAGSFAIGFLLFASGLIILLLLDILAALNARGGANDSS